MASRSASSQRRATDHSGWLATGAHLDACQGRTTTTRPATTTAKAAMAAMTAVRREPRICLSSALQGPVWRQGGQRSAGLVQAAVDPWLAGAARSSLTRVAVL